ncbi:recombinase family protein [bacterium]|nr:recombinase family protein [bacterium]
MAYRLVMEWIVLVWEMDFQNLVHEKEFVEEESKNPYGRFSVGTPRVSSRLGRNTIDTLTTLKFFEDNGVNVVVKSMGNLHEGDLYTKRKELIHATLEWST